MSGEDPKWDTLTEAIAAAEVRDQAHTALVAAVLAALDAGNSEAQTARVTGVARSTIRRWRSDRRACGPARVGGAGRRP